MSHFKRGLWYHVHHSRMGVFSLWPTDIGDLPKTWQYSGDYCCCMPTYRRSILHNSVDAEAISAVLRAVVFVMQVNLCSLILCFKLHTVDYTSYSSLVLYWFFVSDRRQHYPPRCSTLAEHFPPMHGLPIFLSVSDSLIAICVSCHA